MSWIRLNHARLKNIGRSHPGSAKIAGVDAIVAELQKATPEARAALANEICAGISAGKSLLEIATEITAKGN